MQNRYVADVGDYGKYALLRNVAKTGMLLGVNWYSTPDEKHNSDGKHTSYLYKAMYQDYDNELYYILKDMIDNNNRNVSSVQNSKILPRNTVFYDRVLDLSKEPDFIKRRMLRQSWHNEALRLLKDCSIVFYNHRERKKEKEYLDKFRNLHDDFMGCKWLGLKFIRGTIRDYIFILQPNHFYEVKKQCEILLKSAWKDNFSMLDL
ncbi:MAG TPA: hypothetical protein VIO64_03345 [Pseudobacteroides sp.]|uniref:hypothetical protein n=1 Tax=Pseudobacteroides sp. TaxID=1968840 RepID=UPI002F95BD40